MSDAVEVPWRCENADCGAVLRGDEVRHIETPDQVVNVCPHCGSRVGSADEGGTVIPHEKPPKPTPAFASALLYPLGGWGLVGLCIATVVVGLLAFGMPFLYSYVITVMVYGYLCHYLVDIVWTTANDEDKPPEFPDFTSWWDDILQPMLLMVSTTLICFAPAVLWFIGYLVRCWYEGWVPEPDEPMCALGLIAFALLSSFYYPMALLGVVMFDSTRAVNPRFVVPAIRRVFGSYLVVCGFMILTLFVQVGFNHLFRGESLSAHFAGVAISLWAAMVSMRLLGLLYRGNKERLNWF